MVNKIKYKWFDEEDIQVDEGKWWRQPKFKKVDSHQLLCDFLNENDGKIEIVAISCRWCYPTILFYRELNDAIKN